jgi:hypothetical protein
MKKVRAYIIVDLNVADNLTNKEIEKMIGVGEYILSEPLDEDRIELKTEDFEVLDYVDIEIKEIK